MESPIGRKVNDAASMRIALSLRFLYSYPSPIPSMSTKEYFCDCPARCKTRKKVFRSTFYNHSKCRLGPLGQSTGLHYKAFAAIHGVPSGVPQANLPSFGRTGSYQPTEAGHDLRDDLGTSHASQSSHTMRPMLQPVGEDDTGGLRDPVNDGRDVLDSGGEVCWHIISFSLMATHCDPEHCRLKVV
jgi:hypothetical protein